jgi:hypothetical protein
MVMGGGLVGLSCRGVRLCHNIFVGSGVYKGRL